MFFFPEDIKRVEARDGLPGSNTEGRRACSILPAHANFPKGKGQILASL